MYQLFFDVEIGSMLASMLDHPQKRIQKAALISISGLCINGKYQQSSISTSYTLIFVQILRGDSEAIDQ